MALEISHLVTNGCSFTYCQGLYDPPTEGWPRLLAEKLGVPVVNIAAPGSSNDGIHRRTYDYFYKNLSTGSKPLFIVAMSQTTRREEYVIENEHGLFQDYQNISAHDKLVLSKEIYRNMDDMGICFMEVRKLMQWQSIINLFQSNNTPYLTTDYIPTVPNGSNDSVNDYVRKNHSGLNYSIKTNPNTLINFNSITREYPKALDNGHDGKEAQIVLSEYIYKQLIRRYGEIKRIDSDFISLKTYRSQPKPVFERNQWYLYETGKPRHYGLD